MDIISALSALKQTVDLIKLGFDLNDASKIKSALAEFNDKYIALQASTLEIQNQNFLMLGEKKELQEKLLVLKNKLSEKESYCLHAVKQGLFVYKYLKDDQPEHYLCQNCYDKDVKSVLRFTEKSEWFGASYTCAENENHKLYI